jgi:glucosamine--fructose-6-phosphate aminotransferase (isomerizing)
MIAPSITLQEILSQPSTWEVCLEFLQTQSEFRHFRERATTMEWLFIGCGTSFYLAQVAAASFTAITGMRARSLPASEVLLYPKLALLGSPQQVVPVLISRSGRTSEVLRASRYFAEELGIDTLAVTCDGNELQDLASWTLRLPVREQSTVMTGSFTSMLLAVQYLAAAIADDGKSLATLDQLPTRGRRLISQYSRVLSDFVARYCFHDYVFLGQGPFFGIASEAALKVTESSCSYAQVFHTMEFRHGPKSIVSSETLITFMLSEQGYAEQVDVLEEVKSLGGTTIAVTAQVDAHLSQSADLVVEISNGAPEWTNASLSVLVGQLLGVYTAMRKGLDPDHPRNLSRVVLLNKS